MLPQRTSPRHQGRRNIPVGVVIAGVIGLVLVAVFVWVTIGIGRTPNEETVTVDVPVRM